MTPIVEGDAVCRFCGAAHALPGATVRIWVVTRTYDDYDSRDRDTFVGLAFDVGAASDLAYVDMRAVFAIPRGDPIGARVGAIPGDPDILSLARRLTVGAWSWDVFPQDLPWPSR